MACVATFQTLGTERYIWIYEICRLGMEVLRVLDIGERTARDVIYDCAAYRYSSSRSEVNSWEISPARRIKARRNWTAIWWCLGDLVICGRGSVVRRKSSHVSIILRPLARKFPPLFFARRKSFAIKIRRHGSNKAESIGLRFLREKEQMYAVYGHKLRKSHVHHHSRCISSIYSRFQVMC